MTLFLNRLVISLITGLDKLSPGLMVFLILGSAYLSFDLTGNEEHYFALSKQFVEPDWIPEADNLTETAGARLLYQYLVGGMLQVLSFEQSAFFGRLALILAFSVVLSKFYRKFEVSTLEVLLHLGTLYLGLQSFLGNEWIFLDFEPKQLAYVFVFSALLFFFDKKYLWCTSMLAVACYFHILVGGWVALAIFSIPSLSSVTKKVACLWQCSILFLSLLLPLIIYIGSSGILRQTVPSPVNPDWIYVYFRNQHHVGIFSSVNYFISYHLRGLVMVVLAFCAGLFLIRTASSPKTQVLSRLCLASFSIMLLGAVISLVDINGTLLKFHPFRIGAIANFLFLLLLVIKGKTWFVNPSNQIYFSAIICTGFFFVHYPRLLQTTVSAKQHIYKDSKAFEEVTAYIADHTTSTDRFLYIDEVMDGHLSFHRLAKRERFVVKKFVPAERERLYPWYRKVIEKEKLMQNLNSETVSSFLNQFSVQYLLINREVSLADTKLIYSNQNYFLYQL